MEKDATSAGGTEWERETRTATAWGTQESGAGKLHGEARASGGNTGKSPSAASGEAGARGPHGARPAQRRIHGGGRENKAGETSGVRGDNRVCKASGVDHESPVVGDGEGAARPPEWRKTNRGPIREWAGESSHHRALTPPE